ncbi:MAG TPA: caspase family protein [Steroidobacteraceae bacterium]|nr:caspase family protein [Steroidobacteraceae bacterium]
MSTCGCVIRATLLLAAGAATAQQQPQATPPAVKQSPLSQVRNGREAGNNAQILTTGIRSIPDAGYAQALPSNHALIITVSEYQKSPLPGVLTDRKLGIELAKRFGVPPQNIVELSEQQVTREGLKQAFANMNQVMMPGDKLYVYFSGHGARYFNKTTGQCTESLVMQDMRVVTNAEFANMIKPLSAKADKTVVMLDSCHSGGVALAAGSRSLAASYRPKFSPEASSPQCSLAVNLGSFSLARGIDFHTTDHNMVILAAARNNEVAWDTSKGGAMTYNFEQCLAGGAADADHSGALSMQELAACVQARLDKTQEDAARQHATLAGNGALVPSFSEGPSNSASAANAPAAPANPPSPGSPPAAASSAPPPAAVAAPVAIDTLATLNDIFNQRDDRWQVDATLASPSLKIGSNLSMSVHSAREGFVYLFYRGSQPDSLYLLFPNSLDSSNAIKANQSLKLPRQDWSVTALGPKGTDYLMVMVTDTPRDFSALALPAEYVSQAGAFEKIRPTAQAVARIGQAATLSAAVAKKECQSADAKRDLGVARHCSNVFGATLVSLQETD